MKVITSNLTNQQLQQLAHQVLNQFDQTVIDNWMQRMANPTCAPNYFRQDIINHIYTRAGREPDEIVKGMQERAAKPLSKTSAQSQNANTYDKEHRGQDHRSLTGSASGAEP